MTTLLALDTATEACSVALLHDGKVTSHYEVIPRQHAQKLLPMIKQLLAETLAAETASLISRRVLEPIPVVRSRRWRV